MKKTLKDLKNKGAHFGLVEWFINNFGEDVEVSIKDLKSKLIECEEYFYLNWLYRKFRLSGEYIEYWDNGNIYKQYSYKFGVLDGKYIQYHYDGNVCEECCFIKGRLYGEHIIYWESGKVKEESYWENGVKIK